MNDPVEQSRKILVDDMNAILERLNNMQAAIEKLPNDDGPAKVNVDVGDVLNIQFAPPSAAM